MEVVAVIHGAYNVVVALLFLYQGWLGLTIRNQRVNGTRRNPILVRRHRKTGPVLAVMAPAGYLSGAAMVYVASHHIFDAPAHHITGLVVVLMALLTYFLSTRIKGLVSPVRSFHFGAGIALLVAYAFQVTLGLSLLLG